MSSLQYPTRLGLPIHPQELGFTVYNVQAESLSVLPEVNNHHNAWSRQRMLQLRMTEMFRNLESNQFIMPVEDHKGLHATYTEPELALSGVMNYLQDAYDRKERLQFRGVGNFRYEPFSAGYLRQVKYEYEGLV